jgi:hypothetical protein
MDRVHPLSLVWALLGAVWAGPLWGQTQVWRCGHVYTNQPGSHPEQQGCRLIESASSAVIDGGAPPRASVPAARPPQAPPAARPPSPAAPVDRAEQQQRDRDAHAILAAELQRARAHLSALGSTAPPDRDPAAHARDVARAQGDVAAIEREIARRQPRP